MEAWQIEHIEKNRPYLIANTICNVSLYAELSKQEMLCDEDEQNIRAEKTNASRADMLYKIMRTRLGGYDALKDAFSLTRQTGVCRVLEERVGAKRRKIVEAIEYDENHRLGYGGTSIVFKGKMEFREVAVKRLDQSGVDKTLSNELKILKDLPFHSNIVQFLATYVKSKYLLIAFELCGGSLQTCVEDNNFPLDKVDILRQATSGLAYLHSNDIIHGDLKPENILFKTSSQNVTLIKVSDFGLSKILKQSRQSVTASSQYISGTYSWMSPEVLQYLNSETQDYSFKWKKSSDIFPLGCIYCYIWTEGTHPFGRGLRTIERIVLGKYVLPEESAGLKEIFRPLIEKMISLDAAKRPVCEEILSDASFNSKELKLQVVNSDGDERKVYSVETAAEQSLRSVGTSTDSSVEKQALNNSTLDESEDAQWNVDKGTGMETWQRYYLYTILHEVQSATANTEEFVDELLRARMISKTEAVAVKGLWPYVVHGLVIPITTSATKFNYPSIFTKPFIRSNSYNILMDALHKTCNFESLQKLKDGKGIVEGQSESDLFLNTSYAISLNYEVNKINTLLFTLSNLGVIQLRGASGESLLHISVGCGHIEMIYHLHSIGIDKSCQDMYGNYAHHYLGKWSSNIIAVTKALIDIGADIALTNENQESVAHILTVNITSQDTFYDWIQFMFDINMSILFTQRNDLLQSVLHYAMIYLEVEEKTLLLLKEKGALNPRDKNGLSLIHYAAYFGKTKKSIAVLIACGVDWAHCDNQGRTALHWAVMSGNLEAVEYFVSLGAVVNQKDEYGRTPLHFIRDALSNHVEITKILVNKGAQLFAKDDFGNTPAHDFSSAWKEKRGEYENWSRLILDWNLVNKSFFEVRNNIGEMPLPPN